MATTCTIVRFQYTKSYPLYTKRHEIFKNLPGFWPNVLEAAPTDWDMYVQPSDAEILMNLKSLEIIRPELPPHSENSEKGKDGDPRSLRFTFEFEENDFFTDKVLEKTFWWRNGIDGKSGFSSEPVKINWKAGKDLTAGLTEAALKAWRAAGEFPPPQGPGLTKKTKLEWLERIAGAPQLEAFQDLLEKKREEQSFFRFFAYVGKRVTASESAKAEKAEKAEANNKDTRKAAEEKSADNEDEDIDDLEEEDDEDSPLTAVELALEVCPEAEAIATVLAEEIWPNALRYFCESTFLLMFLSWAKMIISYNFIRWNYWLNPSGFVDILWL
jgi:Nucleosome assembly protein (NAP)